MSQRDLTSFRDFLQWIRGWYTNTRWIPRWSKKKRGSIAESPSWSRFYPWPIGSMAYPTSATITDADCPTSSYLGLHVLHDRHNFCPFGSQLDFDFRQIRTLRLATLIGSGCLATPTAWIPASLSAGFNDSSARHQSHIGFLCSSTRLRY